MYNYTIVKNLKLLRIISRLIPLKHKLSFLIKDYLKEDTDLAIRYFKNWFICTSVNKINRSTIEEVILEGTYSQPEEYLIKQLRHKLPDDMVLIDVGGNIGTFLSQFIDKCRQIFVFEPIPRLNNVITKSIEYNKDKKVTLLPKAVGDIPGIVKMLDNNNSNIVDTDALTDFVEIPITTLDIEFAQINKIDFIKIDVEGYEVNVLNGARKIIAKYKPSILIEVHPVFLENYNHHQNEVIRFFEEQQYNIKYFSFMQELRMPRWKRVFSRWMGNKGVRFGNKKDFLDDINKKPRLTSYHFYCEPE